jgi:transcription-repair coupling factor (superfamily II helicase)
MRDLEIRGAGNILGERQHGHMEAVGYDMYCKMLDQAIKKFKGEEIKVEQYDTSVDINLDAFIPSGYIMSESTKLDMYKRIADITTEEERVDIENEMIDRFGEPPESVLNLLRISMLKSMAHDAFITTISQKQREIKFLLYPSAKIAGERIPDMLSRIGKNIRYVHGATPYFLYTLEGKYDILEQVEQIIQETYGLKLSK